MRLSRWDLTGKTPALLSLGLRPQLGVERAKQARSLLVTGSRGATASVLPPSKVGVGQDLKI